MSEQSLLVTRMHSSGMRTARFGEISTYPQEADPVSLEVDPLSLEADSP